MYDSTAFAFTIEFYTSFEENKDYKCVFLHDINHMDWTWGGCAARSSKRHIARGVVDYVCLLSIDGNVFPETTSEVTLKPCRLKTTVMHKKSCKALKMTVMLFVIGANPGMQQTMQHSSDEVNESVWCSLVFR